MQNGWLRCRGHRQWRGGIVGALKVARSGYKALLLEAIPCFCGYVNPFHRRGYPFNAGLHYVATLAEGETFWRLLDDLGVRKLRPSARVSRIARGEGGFLVATESGEQYQARAVISNAEPAITLGKLADAQIVPSRIRERAGWLRPSTGACCAFIGTDLDLPAHSMTSINIQHYEDLDVNRVFETLNAATLQERIPYCFISSASLKDPQGGHAPDGRHTVEIVTCARYEDFQKWASLPATKRGEEYDTLKKKIGRQFVAAAERYLPGLSQHLDVVEFSTPYPTSTGSAPWGRDVRTGTNS